jgi:hypothetical protein
MPPTRCPERLRKLIERLNNESSDESREEARVLREILRDIQKYRQSKKGQDTYVAKLPSTITIDLTDYTSIIRNELAEALADVDPPDLIARIRECPISYCNRLFWAGRTGRAGKKTCDKHVDLWRQREYRRNKKQAETRAAAKRAQDEARKTLSEMKRTAQSVIRAIMVSDAREFGEIDGALWQEFYHDDMVPRSTWIVRNVTHKLYRDGYLDYHESADSRDRRGFSIYDRYTPTRKLINLWNDSLGLWE